MLVLLLMMMIVIILKPRHSVPLLVSLHISVPGSWLSQFTLYNY